MPVKKTTNYISYELKKLEKYLQQLQNYLDNNPPDRMQDRIETFITGRFPIIKVISDKEKQLKCWTDKLVLLPKILIEINTLRREVDGGSKEIAVRGGQEVPGFMDNEPEEEEEEIHPFTNALPSSSDEGYEHPDVQFDDSDYFEQ